MKYILSIGIGLLALGAVILSVFGGGDGVAEAAAGASGEMVAVSLPELSGSAIIGQRAFAARCAACHGPNAGGIEGAGPPLVHQFYVPGHHGDAAFFMAAERGVKSHHWRFGDMPPVEGVTRAEVAAIIDFVREVQRENGIR